MMSPMSDLQCPVVLLLSEDPGVELAGEPTGPTTERLDLSAAAPGDDDALLAELEDTRRGETVILAAPAQRLRGILERHGCDIALPARVEADSDGWRRVAMIAEGSGSAPASAAQGEPGAPEPAAASVGAPGAERHVALPLSRMTGLQMHAITLLRERVFVVEQGTTEVTEIDELDALETTTHHWLELGGRPVAVLRVLGHGPSIAIGRVATDAGHRGRGLAGRLMRIVVEQLGDAQRPVVLLGQSHLEQWYTRFGFVRSGDDVLEVGIRHTPMQLRR